MKRDEQRLIDTLCQSEFRNILISLLVSLHRPSPQNEKFPFELILDPFEALEQALRRRPRINWKSFSKALKSREQYLHAMAHLTISDEFCWVPYRDDEENEIEEISESEEEAIATVAEALEKRFRLRQIRRRSGASGNNKRERGARSRIAAAVKKLLSRGELINVSSVAREANANRRTVRKHIDLLSQV